jgi:hypothetical protein
VTKVSSKDTDFYSDKEAAKRRDETIRRMTMTPPEHKQGSPKKTAKRTPKSQGKGK